MLALALATLAPAVSAQDTREAQRKLEKLRGELKSIAAERREIEGQRGDASRKLREADEQVGRSSRTLGETEAALKREAAALAELQVRRDGMQSQLAAQRAQLATLLRAAYLQGDNAPLKALLSQDSVARANLALAYSGYVQRDQARRIAALGEGLRQLAQVESEIQARRAQLEQTRQQQRQQIATLRKDRETRADVLARLDRQYQDHDAREKALGRDAKALEKLLANLRAAAARAEAERRAAAAREAKQAQARKPGERASPPPTVANAPALKVGGLGWPLSGNLLARYGGRMPDGRPSSGVLIGAPAGSTVTAVADGTVVFAEWMTGYGLILIVDHGNGYMSLYAHNESLLRDAGDTVRRGDAVSRVGSSGGFGTPALYFELRRNGQPVDPATWLQRH
ncbi:MAG: peptidoglycan DD-metalloendopeptidase family protein [Pseudoxanthomonas sp.]